jgi:hypothetical protein
LTNPIASILITYSSEPLALVNRRHTTLVGHAAQLPAGDPTLRIVTWMAVYAKLVLACHLTCPYTDTNAERFARATLIHPHELRANLGESDQQLAERLRVPAEQIARARRELSPIPKSWRSTNRDG